MKRTLIFIAIIVVFITGCRVISTSELTLDDLDENTKEEPVANVQEINEAEPEVVSYSNKDFAGTYIGLHGSAITLFEDGSAEYYCKEWADVERNDTWKLEGDRLVMTSTNLGHDIYADIQDGISTLTFKSDQPWEDEIFVRISDDTLTKDIDSYISLIESQLSITIEKPTDFVRDEFNGFEFVIPKSYMGKRKIEDNVYYALSDESERGLMSPRIENSSADEVSNPLIRDDSEKYLDWIINQGMKILKENLTVDSQKVAIYEGLDNSALENKSVMFISKDGLYTYITSYFDKDSCSAFMTIFASKDSSAVEDVYRTIVESVKIIGDNNTGTAASDSSKVQADNADNNAVSPQLKEFLDSYEACMDEYCEFMKKYNENPNDLEMLSDYNTLLQKYTEFMQKAEQYDTDKMSKEEAKYYMDVMNRVNKKLLDAGY